MAHVSEADLHYLKSIPWCADLINDPNFNLTNTTAREYKESTEDSLTSETLNSQETISAWISLYRQPATPHSRIDEVRAFLTLGPRVCGYPYTCHGGIISTILDEVMGTLLSVNRHVTKYVIPSTATGSLKVIFLKPVRIPATILCSAYFIESQGRKHFLESDIKDRDGVILAKAEGLWIELKGEQRQL